MLKQQFVNLSRNIKTIKKIQPKIKQMYDEFMNDEQESEMKQNNDTKDVGMPKKEIIQTYRPSTLDKFFQQNKKTHTSKVLQRIDKGMKWGLAGEVLRQKSSSFQKYKLPTAQEIKSFLQKQLLKDIQIVKLSETQRKSPMDYAIVATGYSNRHLYSSGKSLVKALIETEYEFSNLPRIHGRKDDEWIMVQAGPKIEVQLMTEQQIENFDIISIWTNEYVYKGATIDEAEYDKLQKEYDNPFIFRDLNKK